MRRTFLTLAALLLASLVATPAAGAAPGPAWSLAAFPAPANIPPGGSGVIDVSATNVGATAASAGATITAVLPEALTPLPTQGCAIAVQTFTCTAPGPTGPGERFSAFLRVAVPASPVGPATTQVSISGGGSSERKVTVTPAIQSGPVPFQILEPGLLGPLTEEDGGPATLAGSRPYQQTLSFQLPSRLPGTNLSNSGHPHEIDVSLPPGLAADPAASPVLCTEAELANVDCPAASVIGTLEVTTTVTLPTEAQFSVTPLFQMVPPPGHPAELAANIGGSGIFTHIFASVRSDSDYGIEISTPDVIAFGKLPIFGIQAQVWGDPSAPVHEKLRTTECRSSCTFAPQQTALLTLPTTCPGQPLQTSLAADSWEELGAFVDSSYESADLDGNPVPISACNQLGFSPTISAQPTTNLVDSPSGLDVDLKLPTDQDKEDRSPAQLRNAAVTLPAGMVVNPSQADGLGACTEAEIGYLGPPEEAAEGPRFSRDSQSCPDAAKLGTVKVTSPLLVRRDEEHKLEEDPETGEPIPRPLEGAVYLAKPFENPFGSLLAIYLAIEDEQTGIVSKLAGRVEPDPVTGQLTTAFEENPQLPLSDIQLHLFKGARASLITPPTCGTHTTTTDLVPWSAPEGEDAHPTSSFQTTAAPSGGACPTQEGDAPNAPSFTAGTLSPQAAAYSPFAFKLTREDGSQRISKIDTTLAPGLTGKLAGIAECSEGQIAQAKSREHPEDGILERESPSCPGSSEVGKVIISAGAGPTPFYTAGRAYLAGPYEGAPLSLAVIVPAIAGPFDLGAVVSRVALHVDPVTAQIHAVSDPLPQILDGIPLDVRSIALTMDRPNFTLNPTSCDPMTITGAATSPLGLTAALSSPFQVGGCSALPFKPKLTLQLRGQTKRSGNPALKAVLTMRPGEANIAKASVALPHSEFLDQGHIRTVCTRVQYAEGGGNGEKCPAGSIYGHAMAITPLLDAPVEGPVYLRSSSHQLPDLVAALGGQISVELDGTVDSVHGGIRNRFEVVPDAPVSRFTLQMQGAKKGLLENSTNLCAATNKATATFIAQNGKFLRARPVVRALGCKGKKGRKGKGRRAATHPVR